MSALPANRTLAVANHKHQEATKHYDRRDRKKLLGIMNKIRY